MPEQPPPWPHAPPHRLWTPGTYFVTASTYKSEHHFSGPHRLDVLHRGLHRVLHDTGWQLFAWAVFSNHYHFVASSPPLDTSADTLRVALTRLHSKTATWVNRLDQKPGRRVWYNFRETRLTYERSALARLHYTHQNPVKHKLVPCATLYPWCSAAWFEQTSTPARVKTIYSFPIDTLKVHDPFNPVPAHY